MKKFFIDSIKIIQFIQFLWNEKIFSSGDPSLVLEVLQKYIELASTEYENTIVMNRDIKASVSLLSVLVELYNKKKSSEVLNQLLKVLEVEFIKRK